MRHPVNFVVAITLTFILTTGPYLPFAFANTRKELFINRGRSVPVPVRPRRATPKLLQTPTLLEGQTSTALPDGGLLLAGGMDKAGPTRSLGIFNSRTGKLKPLSDMTEARAYHTATILPDGRVFVFGGLGKNQQVLNTGIVVDPVTAECNDVSPKSGLTSRAHHTATLLTDGRLLIVGGSSAKGRLNSNAQIWDYRTNSAESAGILSVPRQKHRATLLTDGNVLIESGVDEVGNESTSAELFNVEAKSFSFTSLSSDQGQSAVPFLAASIPTDGASEVPVDTKVALRLSRPLATEVIKQIVRFESLEEGVAVKIVPAETGRLIFINPLEPLRKGTTYKASIIGQSNGASDLTPASISFITVTDKDWNNNSVSDTDWTPSAENLKGNWQTRMPRSDWENQPALQANPGDTALSGRVFTLTGQPLSDVTISLQDRSTRTDSTGRFLLKATAGHQVMLIDGRTANRPGRTYGIFRAGVDITAGKTNVLDYTIWMPKLDMAHAVNIPSPNNREIVITNPSIPGLELHLPPGTVIRDLDGNVVTQLSITPVPTDRPPFPLPPGLNVPVFASIQPGGARVIPPRAKLIYPNYNNEPPGKRINFWNYDPEEKGWYIYGQGTVTANGRQIAPDPGVVIYEFSGIMISDGGSPPGTGREPGDDDEDGDPVDLSTGLFVLEKTDIVLPDTIPIALTRTYRPGDAVSRPFGIGASHPYEMLLWSNNNYQETDLILPDGGRVHYVRISPGTNYWDAVYEHTSSPSAFFKSQIYWNGSGWDLRLKNGNVFVFPEYAPLQSIRDRHGNQLTITRSAGTLGNITQITSPNGRWLQFSYGTGNRISQVKDNSGRLVNYTYDASGRLWKVTDPNGGVTEYTYDSSHRMLTIKDARGIVFLTNEYDSNNRVITQTQADSSTYEFEYTLDGAGKVTQTDVTDPRSNVRRLTFNASGYTLTDTSALGTSQQQTVTYERQSGTNLILSVTDPLSRQTSFSYDSYASITSFTRLAGTQNAKTITFTYEPNFHQVATVTNELNHTASFAYDNYGNLTSITDPLNHQTTFTYNTSGQITSLTDAVNNTTQWTYDGADLASLTNPLGNTLRCTVDAVGRPIVIVDALGRITTYEYDSVNQPTQVTDPRGGITSFSYDENGNLLTVTDPNNQTTNYSFDDMDRLETRTDPLSRTESYDYDENGNVTKFTDRRGKVATFSYDTIDRETFVGFGTVVNGGSTTYESTITYEYDAVGRLEEATDSQAGSITFDYDDFDRLTSETSPQGAVSYAYDAAGRQTSMTVTGRSAVNYSYDNANRLTGITQGSSSVAYTYDAANRRTSLTLPNGLTTEYGYDVGSNLASITYKQGATVLGDLSYEYDAGRQRTRVGGSYARTALPSTLTSATFDAANQMTQRASTSLSYDANGNLTSDGVNTYNWNARNQLTSISGGLSASFTYDAFGRRRSRTVNSQTTDFLYDGADIVQELSGGTPTADMLNGSEVDERHTCNCDGAPRTLLKDALGSAVALTSSTGSVQTEYTYDPFGAVTATGTTSSNSSQFTGRENDSIGLHYYRSRYYSPLLHRFISEDPVGFGGGDANLYAYVGNSPTNFTDPSGNGAIMALGAVCLEGAITGAAAATVVNILIGRKLTIKGLLANAVSGCFGALIGFGLGRLLGAGLRGLGRGLPRGPKGGGSPRECFVAGTLIQTEDGEKRIEDITVGDVVLSSDPSEGERAREPLRQRVTQTFVRDASIVLDIYVGHETISATPEHPFWVVGAGWTAAGELRNGSALLTKDGVVVHVDSVERREGKFKVYNFEVETSHSYYVSSLGVLVHNKCGPLSRAFGKNYPTKPNAAGKPQPYDPTNGQWRSYADNPGLPNSPAARFSKDFGAGVAEGGVAGLTPGPPDLPAARSGAQRLGQLFGWAAGFFFGPR